MLPVAAFVSSGNYGDSHEMVGKPAAPVLVSGIAAGIAWQLLDRRDLTDRLTAFAVAACLGVLWLAVAPAPTLVSDNNGAPGHVIGGIVAGVVLAERLLRGLARRQQRAARPAVAVTHDAGGEVRADCS